MNPSRRLVTLAAIAALVPLLSATALAQGDVSVAPSQLTVAGTRGAGETRTLLLSAPSGQVGGLQLVPLDLPRADGLAVLPQSAISADLATTGIITGGVLTVPVTISLSGAPSGEYVGEMLLRHDGGSASIPLTVRIKDGWALPALVLLAGVGLGMGVSRYRSQGRPRDEILVRVGRLRGGMTGDVDLLPSFAGRIEALLVDAEGALDKESWEDADTAVTGAEALWTKWRKSRLDWVDMVAYQKELATRLEELGDASAYLVAVGRDVATALRDAPDLANPDQLRTRLESQGERINRYEKLSTLLEGMYELLKDVDPDEAEVWENKAGQWQSRLDALSPDDVATYDALLNEVAVAIEEIKQLPVSGAPMGGPAQPRGMGLPRPMRAPLGLPLPVRPLSDEGELQAARRNLRLFTWVSYGLAWLLLAGAGFGELYVSRATFGANAWADYFALLAWGFGAEASRQAITEVIRGWGLAGTP